jgi:hypothetical protein
MLIILSGLLILKYIFCQVFVLYAVHFVNVFVHIWSLLRILSYLMIPDRHMIHVYAYLFICTFSNFLS